MTTTDVIEETRDYLVVNKRSGIPTVPLKKDPAGSSLLVDLSGDYPEIRTVVGRNEWEGGVLHRLDTPTSGLVLIARNQWFYDMMMREQNAGRFVKWYRAESEKESEVAGFIPCPYSIYTSYVESGFTAWGPGRKAVRPVLPGSRRWEDGQRLYRTDIVSMDGNVLTVKLANGFRHQVRCHSAWLGMPLLGDTLYGGAGSDRFGLESFRIEFLGKTVEI